MKYKYDYKESSVAVFFTVLITLMIIINTFYAATLNIYIVILMSILISSALLNSVYERSVMKNLSVEVLNDEVRHYKGESGVLEIRIAQGGIMPVLGGRLKVTAGDDIKFINDQALKIRQQTETIAFFTVLPKRVTIVEIPYVAANRGVSKIVSSHMKIPRIFSFGHMDLKQIGAPQHEIIIYPDKYAVHNEPLKIK